MTMLAELWRVVRCRVLRHHHWFNPVGELTSVVLRCQDCGHTRVVDLYRGVSVRRRVA